MVNGPAAWQVHQGRTPSVCCRISSDWIQVKVAEYQSMLNYVDQIAFEEMV